MKAGVLQRAVEGPRLWARGPTSSGAGAASPGSVSLVPREHGTYGQLVLPLVVAHATGGASGSAWLFTIAAVAAFASHEPLLVVLGRRGARARSRGGSRALRFLLISAGVGLLAAVLGLALGPSPARWSLLGCAALAVPLAAQIARDDERSLLGELLTALLLPALAVPVALSAGVPRVTAASAWLVWSFSFGAATCAVRDTVAHFKRGRSLPLRLAPLFVIAVLAGLSFALGLLERIHLVAVAPMLATLLGIALRPPHPRYLRRVGWILLAAGVITAALLIACGRSGS